MGSRLEYLLNYASHPKSRSECKLERRSENFNLFSKLRRRLPYFLRRSCLDEMEERRELLSVPLQAKVCKYLSIIHIHAREPFVITPFFSLPNTAEFFCRKKPSRFSYLGWPIEILIPELFAAASNCHIKKWTKLKRFCRGRFRKKFKVLTLKPTFFLG